MMTRVPTPAELDPALDRLGDLIDRLRPTDPENIDEAERRIRNECARLRAQPQEAAELQRDIECLLALPRQTSLWTESGVRSGAGFGLELGQRVANRALPALPDPEQLRDQVERLFRDPDDHEWVEQIADSVWIELGEVLELDRISSSPAFTGHILDSVRVLSYRIAGAALDRELLRADPLLEEPTTPFLALNAWLIPILERIRAGGEHATDEEARMTRALVVSCTQVLERVARQATERGISVRLTYLTAGLNECLDRMSLLAGLHIPEERARSAVSLFKVLARSEQNRHELRAFAGDTLSLLARNVTDHSGRKGEHYVAGNRAEWFEMLRAAAGGGAVIAVMAFLKLWISLLNLPPLTEGIAFGLLYGLSFVLIHLLGFAVATKQPAMTAAAIASTLDGPRPINFVRLVDFVQNLIRTQFIAVVGNVAVALPLAWLIAQALIALTGHPPGPLPKLEKMLTELHPISGALLFAAVAGVGLFLTGLVSGYFDNQARYHRIGERVAHSPALRRRFGEDRARRLGDFFDQHYGAILGNLFVGMYLGMATAIGRITGLGLDIRHVTLASANVGISLASLEFQRIDQLLPWVVVGLVGIGLLNLVTSFALALHVAMRSRRVGAWHIITLGRMLKVRLRHHPFLLFTPPPRGPGSAHSGHDPH
jgi:site-specific recombinase